MSTPQEKIWDIRERAFAFAVRVVKFCHGLENVVGRSILTQLLKAGTSVGANLEEAQAGQSKPDFISKNSISLKEARESRYWLRIILASYDLSKAEGAEAEYLEAEASEIALIIGSIIINAKKSS